MRSATTSRAETSYRRLVIPTSGRASRRGAAAPSSPSPRGARTALGLAWGVASLVALLAACSAPPLSAPSRSFTLEVPAEVALVKGDPAGTLVWARVRFGAGYAERVWLHRGQPTSGITVAYDPDGDGPEPARDLNQTDLVLDASADVGLRVSASASAQDVNAYVVLTATGVDAAGRDAGLPTRSEKVRFTF